MQMPSLYKKEHYLPKRDQKQFFAFPEKLGNDKIPFFFVKLPMCGDLGALRSRLVQEISQDSVVQLEM